MDSFGERLRKERQRIEMSQSDIADKIGVAQPVYCKYETGAVAPNINIVVRLAELFDVSVDYLCGKDGGENDD